MSRVIATLALAAVLAGCGGAAPETAAAEQAGTALPDLASCPKSEMVDEDYRERKTPIPLPPAFAGMAATDMDHLAVSTWSGDTVCVDMGWTEMIENPKASPDGRFLAFDWGGYEAFGHIVVDRSGKGQVVETGTAPLAPPTGMRFASIDFSESAFGGFNAFGVWQIEPVGLHLLAKVEAGFPSGDWRLESWAGDRCVNLSVVPIDRPSGDPDNEDTPRDPWFAAETRNWKPAPGRCPQE